MPRAVAVVTFARAVENDANGHRQAVTSHDRSSGKRDQMQVSFVPN
jgi:hypothetical protein